MWFCLQKHSNGESVVLGVRLVVTFEGRGGGRQGHRERGIKLSRSLRGLRTLKALCLSRVHSALELRTHKKIRLGETS